MAYDEETWRAMAEEMGWAGIRVPDHLGGSRLGHVELAILQQEAGRCLLPSPFFATVYLATPAIMLAGSESQQASLLPGIARGETRATVAMTDVRGIPGVAGITLRLEPSAHGYRLSGKVSYVIYGHVADLYVIAARARHSGLNGITLLTWRAGTPGIHVEKLLVNNAGLGGSASVVEMTDVDRCLSQGISTVILRWLVQRNSEERPGVADRWVVELHGLHEPKEMEANSPTHRLRSPTWRAVLKWTALGTAGLLVLILLVLAFVDWNRLKGPIERVASARSGRTVKIDGPLDVHIWSLSPRASVEGLIIGNPPWEASRRMARIDRLNVQMKLLPLLTGDIILPRVELVRPDVYLHRDAQGRANWTFENTRPSNAPAGKPPKLPVIRDFLIEAGHLTIRDELLELKVDGTVQAHESIAGKETFAFRIKGKGTLNEQPFDMSVGGGPLVNLDPDEPYPFTLQVRAGDIRVESDGTVKKPFDLGRLALNVHAKGGDLADLYYLTQLALPNTPPFELSAHVERNVKVVKVTKLAGKIGQSDVGGALTIDASRKRPAVTGDLHSRQLRLADLAAALGSEPATTGSLEGVPAKNPNARLFPTSHLQVNRVRAMDADVRFDARAIDAGSVPMKKVAFHVKLDDGVLAVSPFELELPQGQLSGTARIDARGQIPQTKLDIRAKDVQLDQLKGKKPDAQPPLAGVIQGRAVIEGQGDSVHDFMAGADGRISFILPSGQVNAALAELTGINVARGLGLLLKGNDDKAPIRCGVAQFEVKDGRMRADNVVFDTEDVRIQGRGEIRLGPEELDLSIKGEPKKLRIARLRTPVEVHGHLRDPSIGVDVGKVATQGAVAAAIGVALTPFAAIVAFVDPGLAKNENCAALLDNAESGS